MSAEYTYGKDVHFQAGGKLLKCLARGGVGLLNISQSESQSIMHCVLVLRADAEWAYCFDPDFRQKPYKSKDYELIEEKADPPANLRVRLSWLFAAERTGKFQAGAVEERRCVLICRKKSN